MNTLRFQGLRFNALRSKGIGLLVVGCLLGMLGPINLAQGETVGERFRKQMEKMAALCVAQNLSPTDSRCILPKMKPVDPLATEEGRFAHSIKIPNPVPEDSGYKLGMTSQEYFDHLCKTEAGEYIYKTVENVEGILLMRPRGVSKDYVYQHLYAMEDPAGGALEPETAQDYFVQPPIGKYEFLELPGQTSVGYRRYYKDTNANPGKLFSAWLNGHHERIPYVVALEDDKQVRSQFGYTWRSITRPHDRELGIAGGELIILNLANHEVLAVRRGFTKGDLHPTGLRFEWKLPCPNGPKTMTQEFIQQVLKPKGNSHGR